MGGGIPVAFKCVFVLGLGFDRSVTVALGLAFCSVRVK
ncbi:hypothetical protein SLEP1_g56116 [Rubroshorea leprosula]|uniref:Uncharacterized protein n=1 Tax=Rubroshorea leprosula TaxID=152421 RepID=A0AAV5MKQ0_9ROSI|nr:hypothetical protein SLEP1_g56116 [Rubroshorea leprosula]